MEFDGHAAIMKDKDKIYISCEHRHTVFVWILSLPLLFFPSFFLLELCQQGFSDTIRATMLKFGVTVVLIVE